MKKFEILGKVLSKEEQMKIKGAVGGGGGGGLGCSQGGDFCGVNAGITYVCCDQAPKLKCVNNVCELA
ncbi:MAG: hypothetical protein J0L56_15005 [Chitinophagales bacterium]|nr:hypothetical protein [Chitinophagales bacterium]